MTSIPAGSAITRSYIDLVHNKTERQQMLRNNFRIDCKCVKCEQNLDSDVDYNKLKQLILNFEFRQFLLHWKRETHEIDWKKYHRFILNIKFEELFELMAKIFPEFFPEVTEYFILYYNCKQNSDDIESMAKMQSKIEDLIRVTHGVDHPLYKFCSKTFVESMCRLLFAH